MKETKTLNAAEAIEFYETEKWREMTPRQIALFQLTQPRVCVPWSRFREALEMTVRRPVNEIELITDKNQLIEEIEEKMAREIFFTEKSKVELDFLEWPENHPRVGQLVEIRTFHSRGQKHRETMEAVFTKPHFRWPFMTQNVGWQSTEIDSWRPIFQPEDYSEDERFDDRD